MSKKREKTAAAVEQTPSQLATAVFSRALEAIGFKFVEVLASSVMVNAGNE